MSDHLKEAWSRVATQLNEAEEAKQFNALLESIFKRKIFRVKKSVLESRYSKLLNEMTPEEKRAAEKAIAVQNAKKKQAEKGAAGTSERTPHGDVAGPETEPAAPAADKPAAAPTDAGKPAAPAAGETPAPATPVSADKIKALQAKTPAVVKAIIDRGGNGLPDFEDMDAKHGGNTVENVLKKIQDSAGSLDPVLIDAVTKSVNEKSAADPKLAINDILSQVKDKGKFDNPKMINGIYSEVSKLVPQMKSLKTADDTTKTAYSLYISFVMANGYAEVGLRDSDSTNNIGRAFSMSNTPQELFSIISKSSKTVSEEHAIEAALEWVNNNAGELQDEAAAAKIQKNLPIYIKNVYKYRALGATLKKQSDVIFKMTKGG